MSNEELDVLAEFIPKAVLTLCAGSYAVVAVCNLWNRLHFGMVEERMKREELDKLIGKEVIITFVDGTMARGIVEYVPEFSAKYQWRKPGYYYAENTAFKASHVRKVVKQ